LRKGDIVVAVDGRPMTDPRKISQAIKSKDGGPVAFTVERGTERLTYTVKPVFKDPGDGEKRHVVGISFVGKSTRVEYIKYPLLTAVQKGFDDSLNIVRAILDTLKRAATRNLTKEEADGIGGPVKIAQVTGEVAQQGWISSMLFAAMLSVNLGLMNLLPFPALDGGRILFLGYELVARRPIDPNKESLVHTVGMVMLLAFMLFITYRDIWSMIRTAF
jgi:regulator of sigma E protease